MQFVRLVLILAVVLTLFYVTISLYSRSVRKERLEKTWDADPQGDALARDKFIEDGMEQYRNSLRRRLILLVYVVPIVVIGAIMYAIN